MNLREFRESIESYRRSVDEEARAFKDTYLALDRLHSLFERFDPKERALADMVLAEWALSEDEGLRFDALALIDEFDVRAAAPALEKLVRRLELSSAPGAPYEIQKAERILGKLRTSAKSLVRMTGDRGAEAD